MVIAIIPNAISLAFIAFLLTVHSHRMYQDLFTAERKSITHRRWLPKKNENFYQTIAWFTFFAVLLFWIGILFRFLEIWSKNHELCAFQALSFQLYNIGKLFMYWLFIFRLRSIFDQTSFAYNPRWLNFWAVFFFIYILIAIIVITLAMLELDYECDFEFNVFFYINFGMFLVQDLVFSIGFVIAFVIPLKRVLNQVDKHSHSTDDSQHHKKFVYAAIKTTTLTAVTVISTVFVLILFAVTQFDVAWLDMLFNTVCLFLMTPYYDDTIYYQNICWCCIKCCTPKKQAFKSNSHFGPNINSAGTSVATDTEMIQIE